MSTVSMPPSVRNTSPPSCGKRPRYVMTSSSGGGNLLVDHPSERGRHPGALVEAEGAGVVLRVDAQPDAALAALPEPRERVGDERRTDAALAPRAPREERVDEAAAVAAGRRDRPGDDLVAGADDAPERGVEAVAREATLRPLLEVARRVAPVLREGLLVRGVEVGGIVRGVERDDPQALRPLGGRGRRVEHDPHLAEDAHRAIAARLEEPAAGSVGLEHARVDRSDTGARRVLLELGGQHRADPAAERVRVDVALGPPDPARLA